MSSLHPAHPRQSRKFQIEGGGVDEDAAWSAEGSTAGFTIDTGTGMITGVMPVQGEVYPIVRIYCRTELTVIWPDGRELSDWTVITTSILPAGLILVRATGVLRGRLTREDAGKTHLIKFTVPNAFGEDTKTIELVAGGDHEGNVRFRETILPAAAIHGAP